jgi:hypothetical protein
VGRIRACIGDRFLRTDYVSPRTFASRHHGWLTPAAPGCTSSVRCEKRYSRCTNARFQERRVSARRGSVTDRARTAIGFCGLITFRLAHSPPSTMLQPARRPFAVTIFALYKTFPRAAGVSPPWVAFALASAIGFCGLITFRPAHSRPGTTAGLRQPLLVARRSFAVKNDIRAVQTHVSKSGGCQPAVGRIRACIGNRFLRTDYVSPRTFASRHHGWLTPAAPGCTRWHPLNVWRKFFGPICVRRCKYGSRTTAGSHPLVHPFTFASVAVAVGPVADGQSRGCGYPAIFPDSCSADAAILCTDRCGQHCNSK